MKNKRMFIRLGTLGLASIILSLSGAEAVLACSSHDPSPTGIELSNLENLSASESKAAFEALSDDDIVCYLDGIPVMKKYVSEDGEIDLSKIDGIAEDTHNTYATENIPSNKTNAELIKKLTADRFVQQTNDYYLNLANSRSLAAKYTNTSWSVACTSAAGYIVDKFCTGQIGTAYAVYNIITSIQKADIATKIRSFTDYNKPVRFRVMKTTYGYFYAVDSWNGRTIDTTLTNSSGAKEVLIHKDYR